MPERLLKYYRPYRKTLFFALLGSVITSALDLCFPLFMRYILGDVLPEGNLFLLGQATIILLFLYLLNFIISYQVSRHGRLMGAVTFFSMSNQCLSVILTTSVSAS